ncbi:MAG: aminotransferase class V-fold PLP-dependent enzyme [Elusimicrobia bacterium]|jgi:cysteine desulfurase family protein|nr:aminotransferase class V-fold PLP-dependent enzyme [Elusimicrobiota bacterium]
MDLYFDNAATSWPKPPAVLKSFETYQRTVGASAGRGAYPRAQASGSILAACRKALAVLVNAPDPERVIFTLNCSDALNMAIQGIPWRRGDRVLVTPFEHNSVLRPLHALKARRGILIDCLPVDPEGRVRLEKLSVSLRPRTKLVACVHASNVTGVIQPVAEVGAFARRKGIPFLVDAAQSAGAIPLDMGAMKIDLLAFPGHKGLLGPLGTGALVLSENMDLEPYRQGGTGSLSELEVQPLFYPDRLETGSHNAPGLLGLWKGVQYVAQRGVASIRRHERALLNQFREGIDTIPQIRYIGPSKSTHQVAVVSLLLANEDPRLSAARLWKKGRVMVRAGLHCAPWAHKQMGTFPQGTFRFSFGPYVTSAQIDRALGALRGLARGT